MTLLRDSPDDLLALCGAAADSLGIPLDLLGTLSRPGQGMDVLAADVDSKSAEFGWEFTPRPDDGYSASVTFQVSGPVHALAEQAYGSALSLIWGGAPTIDQCLARIQEVGDLL